MGPAAVECYGDGCGGQSLFLRRILDVICTALDCLEALHVRTCRWTVCLHVLFSTVVFCCAPFHSVLFCLC